MNNDPLEHLDDDPEDEAVLSLDEGLPADEGGETPADMALAAEQEEPAVEAAPETPAETPGTGTPPATADATSEQQAAPNSVPLAALLDERDKRQDTIRRAEAAENELQQMREYQQNQARLLQQQQNEQIDPLMDPQAFRNSVLQEARQEMAQREQQMAMEQENARLNQSEQMARQADTEGILDTAFTAWQGEAQQNPALQQRILNSPHPWGEVKTWYKEKQALDQIGSDPAAYEAQVRAKLLAELGVDPATVPNQGAPAIPPVASSTTAPQMAAPAPAAVPAAAPPALPRSLANAGTGGMAGTAPSFDAAQDPLNGL